MDQERRNSGQFGGEIRDFLRWQEEIESLMAENKSSFTALLGLPANQAMQLLHDPEAGDSSLWQLLEEDPKDPAAEDSPQTSSSMTAKMEAVSDSNLDSSSPASKSPHRILKRKEQEKSKAKKSAKKSKNSEENGEIDEKLPYVHVRARRGQATDSHSLAERARREKINARMKLLQELVPGCSKISGTALVLDEIINHVQSLQRQVEFLSMRLAAINPRIDFNGLDGFVAADGNGGEQSGSQWAETPQQQQSWRAELPPPPPVWWRVGADQRELAAVGRSLLRYGSVDSASLRPNQLKQEL